MKFKIPPKPGALVLRLQCRGLAGVTAGLIILSAFWGSALHAESLSSSGMHQSLVFQDTFSCQTPVASSRRDSLMSAAQKSYDALQTLSAEFVQSSELAALGAAEESGGSVFFMKPGRMRWNYVTPTRQQFLVGDATLWFYQAEENQVVIDRMENFLISDVPVTFLLGVGKLSEDFRLESACENAAGYVLSLVPVKRGDSRAVQEEGGEDLRSLTLVVDSKEYLPLAARIADVGGNVTSIVFRDRRKSLPEPVATLFEPHFPPGVDTIDRRGVLSAEQNRYE